MTVSGSPPRPPPGPSDKGKAKVGEPTDDDQSDRIYPEPNPSINPSDGQETNVVRVLFNPGPRPSCGMPTEAMCFTMKVTLLEISEPHMKLRLSRDDAFHLTESYELLRDPPILFSRDLLVLDCSNRLYKMHISNHRSGSLSRYHVNTEWREFALSNKLREGDNLLFYRFLDDASRHWYYRLDVLKIPPPSPSGDPGDDLNCCLSRTLSPSEVGGGVLDPILILDEKEAYDLTSCEDYLGHPLYSSKTLCVYDERCVIYKLKLSPFIPNKSFVGYYISGEWAELVADNKLVVGDRIFFYMYPFEKNADASGRYSYDLKFIRKKPKLLKIKIYKRTSEEEKCPDRIMKPGPGSRDVSNENSCFKRGLTALEVSHDGGKPRLFLDARNAGLLLGCPNIDTKYKLGDLRENLVVFDAGNRQYDMLLSHFRTPFGDVIYVVDAGWQRFVKIHTLEAGDVIFVYRIIDDTVNDKPYYVVRYFKNNFPSHKGMSGEGPSGSTGAGPSGSTRAAPIRSTRAAPIRSTRAGPSGSGAGPSGSTRDAPIGSTRAGPSGSGAGPSGSGAGSSGSGAGPSGSGAGPSGSTRDAPIGSTRAGPSGSGAGPSGSGSGSSGSGAGLSGSGAGSSGSGAGPSGSTRDAPIGSTRAGPSGSGAGPSGSGSGSSGSGAGPSGSGAGSSGSGSGSSGSGAGPNGSTGAGPSGGGAGPSGSSEAGPSGSTGDGPSGSTGYGPSSSSGAGPSGSTGAGPSGNSGAGPS